MAGLVMKETANQGQAQQARAESFAEPVFFFDGDFRTWGQVVQRARLNQALISYAAAANRGS